MHLFGTFGRGYWTFLRTGTTPVEAYLSMRELFWRTDGRFNDVLTRLSAIMHPPYAIPLHQSVFGDYNALEIVHIVNELKNRGYCVFRKRLSEPLCEELLQLAAAIQYRILLPPSGDEFRIQYSEDTVPYESDNVISPQYNAPAQTLMENPVVQDMVSDPLLLDISQRYFGASPVFDFVALWWSPPYLKHASSEAAQLFHFDMDRLKFLKFFVYLTDVGPDNGPHTYIAGSHKRKPRELHRDGRILDEEIAQYYSDSDIVEITGPRGTVFVADTRGFHKGKAPMYGDRLILQSVFATNLFGENYSPIYVNGKFTERFVARIRQYRRTYLGSVLNDMSVSK